MFNVGTGQSTSVMTVVEMLMKNYGGSSKVEVTGNFRIGDIRHNYSDITKIGRILGFAPHHSFEQGLALLCEWVRAVGTAGSEYERSLQEMRSRGLLK